MSLPTNPPILSRSTTSSSLSTVHLILHQIQLFRPPCLNHEPSDQSTNIIKINNLQRCSSIRSINYSKNARSLIKLHSLGWRNQCNRIPIATLCKPYNSSPTLCLLYVASDLETLIPNVAVIPTVNCTVLVKRRAEHVVFFQLYQPEFLHNVTCVGRNRMSGSYLLVSNLYPLSFT